MRAIPEGNKECYLCHRNGEGDPLDIHHVYFGSNRKKSEEHGAVIWLCHGRCHLNGINAVHQNATVSKKIQRDFQRKLMEQNEWTKEDFIKEFGRSYL